jgi:hypothetical protein
MALKSDHKWCETTFVEPTAASHLSLHPFHVIDFNISRLGSTQESSYLESSEPVVIVHHLRFFYLNHFPHEFKSSYENSIHCESEGVCVY